MFHTIKDPPQWLVEGLWAEEQKTADRPCHDCGAKPGEKHTGGCDTAHCLATGIQRLQCDCGNCGDDVWTGIWPGIKECYEKNLVCFDTASGRVMFDLNAEAVQRQIELGK